MLNNYINNELEEHNEEYVIDNVYKLTELIEIKIDSLDTELMSINYEKLSQLYMEDINTKLGHNKQISLIKDIFDKNNQTLSDYFNQCLKLTENSKYY